LPDHDPAGGPVAGRRSASGNLALTTHMPPDPETLGVPPRTQIGIGDCRISARAKELVLQVLEANRLSAGPMMDQFEREVARLHDCRFGLMCNSGTSALHIALAALKEKHGWDDGDEVLVPALTFVATANVVLYNGLKPVFVDVEPEYYCIDPSLVEARVTPRTRAVVPVHVAGLACDMDPILELTQAHGLRVVEDCAEAMTASYKGRPVGSFGDVACFSTYIAHVITTGVGGLCTTNDPELIDMLKSLMNHGRDSIYIHIDDDQGAEGDSLLEIVDRRFSFVRLGHSFRCTEMEAALGVAELEQLEFATARRMKVVARLLEGLTPLEGRLQLPRPRPGAEHAYMFFPLVILDPAVERHDLIAYLEEHGIETRYLLPLINQPVYRRLLGDLDADYPVAARLNERGFYVGCQAGMSDEDVEYVVSSFLAYFGEHG
jgi:perosamine synthetase